MISYSDACAQVQYNRTMRCPIEPMNVWAAYKKGEVKQFATKPEALAFSPNVERITLNEQEIKQWCAYQIELEIRARDVWYEELKNEYYYNENPKLFEACYNEACVRSEHAGYDEVEGTMDRVVEFAKKIRYIALNEKV